MNFENAVKVRRQIFKLIIERGPWKKKMAKASAKASIQRAFTERYPVDFLKKLLEDQTLIKLFLCYKHQIQNSIS